VRNRVISLHFLSKNIAKRQTFLGRPAVLHCSMRQHILSLERLGYKEALRVGFRADRNWSPCPMLEVDLKG
jgi:hypothetical protein